jgi:hypothetical protein
VEITASACTAIKNAFESLINDNLENFNTHDIFEKSEIRMSISSRVANLLDGKKLPYMKCRADKNKIIINVMKIDVCMYDSYRLVRSLGHIHQEPFFADLMIIPYDNCNSIHTSHM